MTGLPSKSVMRHAEGAAVALHHMHGHFVLDVLHASFFPGSAPNALLEEDDASLVDVVDALLAHQP